VSEEFDRPPANHTYKGDAARVTPADSAQEAAIVEAVDGMFFPEHGSAAEKGRCMKARRNRSIAAFVHGWNYKFAMAILVLCVSLDWRTRHGNRGRVLPPFLQ